MIHHELSELVVGAMYEVHFSLGPGLLESAYEGAMAIELAHRGIPFVRQHRFEVRYRDRLAGEYFADVVVDGRIILELKSVTELTPLMKAQLLNYLRISKLRVGYLVNFHGTHLEWKRLVL